MKKDGIGGAKTNQNGLSFEEKTSLENKLLKKYNIKNSIIFDEKNKIVGYYLPKNKLYKYLETQGINWKIKLSKKLLPDECLININNKTVYIVEKKYQEVHGSVDEKLPNCDFKKKKYEQLFAELDYKVEFIYILNDWFKNPRYKDILEYIKNVDCSIYFNDYSLSIFNI